MHVIGLTGGIATGKSTVASMLAAHGATVVDADELAHDVVRPGQPALAEIRARFGDTVIAPDGSLDRAATATIVFADEQARRDLERITHPRIAELTQQRIADAIAADAPVVIVDIPLLFENNREEMFEGVLLVYAPETVQVTRLMARDGIDADAASQRLAAQLPIEEKRQRATWVIDNRGALDATHAQVDTWWNELQAGQL
ncbi:MAG: dephospho-CoA kinase [Candidatus Dormibacteria bacterium]